MPKFSQISQIFGTLTKSPPKNATPPNNCILDESCNPRCVPCFSFGLLCSACVPPSHNGTPPPF